MSDEIYVVRPLEKKSIYQVFDIYETLEDGTIRGFIVEEHYRWGIGFLSPVDDVLPRKSDHEVRCRNDIGYGTDLDDGVATFFNFDENYTDEEKDSIKERWYDYDQEYHGIAWIDNSTQYSVDEDYIVVIGPFEIDLVDEKTGNVIKSNIKLKK